MDAVMTDLNGGNAEGVATRESPNLETDQQQFQQQQPESPTSLKQAIQQQQQQNNYDEQTEVGLGQQQPDNQQQQPMDSDEVGDCVERALAEIDGIASDNFNGDSNHQHCLTGNNYLNHNNKGDGGLGGVDDDDNGVNAADQLEGVLSGNDVGTEDLYSTAQSMKRELSSPEDALGSPKRRRYGARRSGGLFNRSSPRNKQHRSSEEDIRKTLESEDDATPEPVVRQETDEKVVKREELFDEVEKTEIKEESGEEPLKGFNIQEYQESESNAELLREIIAEAETKPAPNDSIPPPVEPTLIPETVPEPLVPTPILPATTTPRMTNSSGKRRKTGLHRSGLKNADSLIDQDLEEIATDSSEDHKMVIDYEEPPPDNTSIKSEKSANSSTSNKSRRSRGSRGASPGLNKSNVKAEHPGVNPLYMAAFNHGWKRELVYRASGNDGNRRLGDVYYYSPTGKKLRSFKEIQDHLAIHGSPVPLHKEHFCFQKEPVGVNDESLEVIRDAKKPKDAVGVKVFHLNKSIKDTPPPAKRLKKTSEKAVVTPPSHTKTSPKHGKTPSSAFKVKLPSRKSTPKREIKSPPMPVPVPIPVPEPEASPPPMWSSSPSRRSQSVVDKSPIVKAKRLTKKKQLIMENDARQNFMFSLCAGYNALYRIFQYLKVQELLRAGRVCRMWRDLANHTALWKTVRMKNSQVTDWEGLADTLSSRGTQHLDLRKMLIVGDTNNVWTQFVTVIPRVKSLIKLELCRCPASVVEKVTQNCPQLQILSAISIKAESLNINTVSNLTCCMELRLKALNGMSLEGDLTALENLKNLTHLSLTSVKELGKKNIEVLQNLQNLETLELGECSDLPERFGSMVLVKLKKLERLRLEKGEGHCCTFDILDNISKLERLVQLELVNFDVKTGFDNYLAACKNMKKLLVIPTYICQSATSNNMVLGGVTKLSSNLTHFIWGVTQELLRVTEIFRDQCNQSAKQMKVDSIPVLKPVPCYDLIKDMQSDGKDGKDEKPPSVSNPQIEILPLPSLQKLLITALPKTRVKILKIPYHATWRQSFNDNSTQ